ncbi:hypothetical protein SCUCBS95973_002803 [Sporothrix curviconia]|uniref:Dopey N-terminal domain-containing protein n=1 Tax=Sporothrix curviconia TaxID=1260050 RepID=A0ABP0BB37_9PEZI
MALELPGGRRSMSPESSGRDSPAPRQWRNQLGADEPHTRDKAFRKYAAGVDRALSLFETALQEWADYISFLNRLLKALQARQDSTTTIPAKALVAKRLSQCLNPSLPSGVHQKALEVYNIVFSIIGTDGLSRDMPLYLPGLAPTLSFASLSARAHFFDLLERHFLDLDPRSLRPALKSLILALLPALEDETAEDFDRTLKLLNRFKAAVRPLDSEELTPRHATGDDFFWQCFFLATVTSHSRRPGALAYLTRYLPKLGLPTPNGASGTVEKETPGADAELVAKLSELITSPEPGLLVRCFTAGLADEQLLIQRGFLDLLVTHLPLHSTVLQARAKPADLQLLMRAACGVVTRREMSLNRRLMAWLLGPTPVTGDTESALESPSFPDSKNAGFRLSPKTSYFEENGLQAMTQALLSMVQSHPGSTPAERARPYRICLSLMDRWEIGGLVVPEVFMPIVDSVRKFKAEAPTKADFNEVLRSAGVFFDGVESGLIYSEMLGLVAQAIGPGGTLSAEERADKLALVKFIIAHFNVREDEMATVHAPLSALSILCMLEDIQKRASTAGSDAITEHAIQALTIAADFLDIVPKSALSARAASGEKAKGAGGQQHKPQLDLPNAEVLKEIRDFYVNEQGSLDTTSPPYGPQSVGELLLQKACSISRQSLLDATDGADLPLKSRVLLTLLDKIPLSTAFNVPDLLSALHSRLSRDGDATTFTTFSSILSTSINLHLSERISTNELSSLVPPLVARAWKFLSASEPKYHVETVRNLWLLQTALGTTNRDIEAAISQLMIQADTKGTFATRNADPGRNFGVLWLHTLQDSPNSSDRRTPKTPKTPSSSLRSFPRLSGVDHYDVMLTRPLLLMLDALLDERTQLFMTVKAWLVALVGLDRLFLILAKKFLDMGVLRGRPSDAGPPSGAKAAPERSVLDDEDSDTDMYLYYLRTLSNIFRWAPETLWAVLARRTVSNEILREQASSLVISADTEVTYQEFFVHVCMKCIVPVKTTDASCLTDQPDAQLCRFSLSVLHQILLSPHATSLAKLHLEDALLDRLAQSLQGPDPYIQALLLDVLSPALKLRDVTPVEQPASPSSEKRTFSSTDLSKAMASPNEEVSHAILPPPPALLKCIQAGLSAPNSRAVLDSWVGFLSTCLPLYSDSIFQVLIPLVETLCAQIGHAFSDLQETFRNSKPAPRPDADAPETTLVSLLNALEQILATGHQQLLAEEARVQAVKSPDQPQSFFGNIFASDAPQTRSATANDRLTVLLAFQDAVRICFRIWSWGKSSSPVATLDMTSAASFNYTSMRMRNRARRLLEHLFRVETLECLETAIDIWRSALIAQSNSAITSEQQPTSSRQYTDVFDLLLTLDASRPRHTIPAIFNSIYSRTNPAALDPARKSTLTISLQDTDIVVFLVDYARSLEDDVMDEIWQDCTIFLKDLLGNPFPHRQSLPCLLEFAAVLGEKVDNTNFGEQRKMRRELGDMFLRLLTALFTTRPFTFADGAAPSSSPQLDREPASTRKVSQTSLTRSQPPTAPALVTSDYSSPTDRADDVVGILSSIVPNLPKVLMENDRVQSAATTISTNVIGPALRAKTFPETVSRTMLVLLQELSRLPNNQKGWKKDVSDAFNDARFFSTNLTLVQSDWLNLLRQWALNDKERMPELLARITAPTTAGIVFGVGATSARLESDRRTQLTLRRMTLLILAAAPDAFVADLPTITEKLVELLGASATSSPSSTTRAEVFMVLRALVLKTSAVHLAGLWPLVDSELHAAISSIVAPDSSTAADTYNNASLLQACKLLDLLVCVAPDDFQLREWLFVTDTIDAVYRSSTYQPVALADELSEELGSAMMLHAPGGGNSQLTGIESVTALAATSALKRPLLGGNGGGLSDEVSLERKDELVSKVLRPFFSQLSIYAFESTYAMVQVDMEGCEQAVLKDIFDERAIVKAL